jgi:hypothetical protein
MMVVEAAVSGGDRPGSDEGGGSGAPAVSRAEGGGKSGGSART